MTKRPALAVSDYVQGVLDNDRTLLAKTITLIESSSAKHSEPAQLVLKALMPHAGKSIRVGVTGIPGVGKSTFIECLGSLLTEQGHQVAVMAVDPSSALSGGSILGDKTRMEKLSVNPKAFIRPSPSGGTLGGVTRRTRETIIVCEAAGYDVILIETVGVGQSEIAVRSMVDFFLLLMLTGAGDELQGIKRGIMELADALVVNKADGENLLAATTLAGEFNKVLHYLSPATEGWTTQASACSSTTGVGVPEVWKLIKTFKSQQSASGALDSRRRQQARDWMYAMVEEQLLAGFRSNAAVRKLLPEIEALVLSGELAPTTAAKRLIAVSGQSGS